MGLLGLVGMVFGRVGEETPKFELLGQAAGYQIRRYAPSVVARTESAAPGSKSTSAPFRRLAQYIGVFGAAKNVSNAGSGKAEKISMTAPVLMASTSAAGVSAAPEPETQTATHVVPQGHTAGDALGDALLPAAGQAEKISMTAPVLMTNGAHSTGASMSFILPSTYTCVHDAPRPNDPMVTLHQLPQRTCAVRGFTWSLSEAGIQQNLAAVLEELAADEEWAPVCRDQGEGEGEGEGGGVEWTAAGFNPPFCVPFLKTNEIMVSVTRRGARNGDASAAAAAASAKM